MQAQRAGKEPSDSSDFPAWSWKQEAFTNVCPTLKKTMSAKAKRDLTNFPGYFEAGSACTVFDSTRPWLDLKLCTRVSRYLHTLETPRLNKESDAALAYRHA